MSEPKAVKQPKQTKTPAPAAPAAPAPDKGAALKAAREARTAAESKDMFFYVGKPAEGSKKLAPQAQVIVNTIQAAGDDGIVRTALVSALKGVLTTRQPESRILSYYQKDLVEQGHIRMEKAAAPAKE